MQNLISVCSDDKCYLLNRDNLTQPIQTHRSRKKAFSQCYFAFPKSTLNFAHLTKKDDPHR